MDGRSALRWVRRDYMQTGTVRCAIARDEGIEEVGSRATCSSLLLEDAAKGRSDAEMDTTD